MVRADPADKIHTSLKSGNGLWRLEHGLSAGHLWCILRPYHLCSHLHWVSLVHSANGSGKEEERRRRIEQHWEDFQILNQRFNGAAIACGQVKHLDLLRFEAWYVHPQIASHTEHLKEKLHPEWLACWVSIISIWSSLALEMYFSYVHLFCLVLSTCFQLFFFFFSFRNYLAPQSLIFHLFLAGVSFIG